MAVIIVHCYPVLLDLRNGDQATPLEIIAARPSAFKSGTYLTWGKRILYHCKCKCFDLIKKDFTLSYFSCYNPECYLTSP